MRSSARYAAESAFASKRYSMKTDLNRFVLDGKIDFIGYGNADITYVNQLPPHKGFHIIRDPRDIVVSAYFSHLYSHSTSAWQELEDHRQQLRSMSFDDGLMREIAFRKRSFGHMNSWDFDQPNILEIRFEDFIKSNYDILLSVFGFLGILDTKSYDIQGRMMSVYRTLAAYLGRRMGATWFAKAGPRHILAPELLTIAWRNSFQFRSSGRKAGDEDTRSHYRKGKSGDWKDHFKQQHIDYFKELYPGLVPKLKYHPDDSW